MRCKKCRAELDYIKDLEVDWNWLENEMLIEQEWECLDCDCVHVIQVKGKILKVSSSCEN